MRSGAYVRVPIMIISDRRFIEMPDGDFRKYIESLFDDENNIRYDSCPVRLTWLKVRKQRTKEVMGRDENKCRECGSVENLEIDHIKPLSRGGTNDIDNLQILCRKHNRKKRDHWSKL